MGAGVSGGAKIGGGIGGMWEEVVMPLQLEELRLEGANHQGWVGFWLWCIEQGIIDDDGHHKNDAFSMLGPKEFVPLIFVTVCCFTTYQSLSIFASWFLG